MTAPATYADWAALLRRFKEGGSDDEVLAAMRAGTIVWQSGVAERFVTRLTDAVNARMNVATDAFDRAMGRARDESEVIAALLGLRRAMTRCLRAADLPALPPEQRRQCMDLVWTQAERIQESFSGHDREGALCHHHGRGGELLITIMSSLAQEESRSISENTTWGKRKQFAEGKTSVGYSAFLGYDKDFEINEEQAKIVRLIYKLFLGGRSFYAITKELEKRGIKSPSGKDKWYISTVRSILTNEKYRGDALIQKEYTADFLDKTRRKNTGEIPQYYVEEHHEAIIPPDLFDFVQSEIKRREQNGKHSGVSIFANKIKCGCCGGWYGAKVWHSTDKYRRVIYRCNKKYAHKGKPCGTRHLTEEEIKRIFVKALNSLMEVKENVIAELRSLIDSVCQMEELTEERNRIEQELRSLAERLETLIRENARVAQDQTAYLKQENEIRALYVEKQGYLEKLDEQIAERESKRKTLEGMIQVVYGINGEQFEFDEDLWSGLLDHIAVKEDGEIVVVFKGGIEITVE